MQKKFMSVAEVAKEVEVTTQTIWRWAREGKFPKPFSMNGRTLWIAAEVEAWVAAQIENREVA